MTNLKNAYVGGMSMEVLGIVCSSRKGGNTELLVKEALSSAEEAGAHTELVSVIGKNIGPCDGCNSCRKTGVCHLKDDMSSVYKHMETANAIIFGSPVYFGTVSAQAKAIMDRTFLFLPNMNLKGKVAAPILAVKRIGGGQTRNLLYGYFMAQGMIPVRGAIGYGREKGDVKQGVGASINLSALDEARIVGKEVVQMVRQLSGSQG
jgi:multimeric flavodoxin WrbA